MASCLPATTDAGKQTHHGNTRAADFATLWQHDAAVAARLLFPAWQRRTERDGKDISQSAADSTVEDNAVTGGAEADGRATGDTVRNNVLVTTPCRNASERLS